MQRKSTLMLVAVLMVFAAILAACPAPAAVAPTTVEVTREVQVEVEVPVEVTREVEVVVEVPQVMAALGSAERPIKVLFVPSVEVDAIVSGGAVLADALKEATGLNFEVAVPTSYAATIEEMCASPDDTIGFIPALGYVLANQRCGVQVGAAAIRNGLSWYTTQYVVPFDSPAQTLEDLAGLTWGIPDFGSTSGYLYPAAQLKGLGVEPGEIVETGSHNNAMLAVYNGEVGFATAYFSPPLLPSGAWVYGVTDPEIWREAGVSPVRNAEGRTFVAGGPSEGGYRVLDARSSVTDTAPDIFEKTRILALTAKIPNDSISFGPEFPLNTSQQIVKALVAFAASEACEQSICSDSFYNWTGLEAASDSFYDPVRDLMTIMGMTEQDVLGN
ncbi:MAG: PhnD/SsuA/transferrin family substrate-binding protein [Caldilineaceae bacterium]|nr:PhnD/SsuA/transferrin family substrate-binding protein [Caldilineaceae bacterium]MBP8106113.1 PhnD/SsuA/transferrin family substrate-binding protein [Caldilineaceae bacterium]MBP9073962.1 PhnD/SsuA/transferrin family substrate-binding protein [Caldilineaceae bacterium]